MHLIINEVLLMVEQPVYVYVCVQITINLTLSTTIYTTIQCLHWTKAVDLQGGEKVQILY